MMKDFFFTWVKNSLLAIRIIFFICFFGISLYSFYCGDEHLVHRWDFFLKFYDFPDI